MGNVISWSQIHPSIKSEAPFVGVVIIDPERQLCVSELIPIDSQLLNGPETAASGIVAAAQQATTRVASAYRARRKEGAPTERPESPRLRVVRGGIRS